MCFANVYFRVFIGVFLSLVTNTNYAQNSKNDFLKESIVTQIDSFVNKSISEVEYPGVSIAIVKGKDFVYKKGYGFADLNSKKKVTTNTLFEIGSNTKAFTGLGLLLLVERGDVQLEDPVQKHIPWFSMNYKGIEQSISLSDLLYHTSGIPLMAINRIYPSTKDNSLEEAVRSIMKSSLDSKPGEKFFYSSVNYDIIGYIIETVTGVSYEAYITTEILDPLKMKESYFYNTMLSDDNMSKGYKIDYSGNTDFEAPIYRGNTPAGYLISNADDMLIWLKANVHASLQDSLLNHIIIKSHEPNRAVPSTQVFPYKHKFHYSSGWLVFEDENNHIAHGGSNPNFASYILINKKADLGIAVLGNRNSSYPFGICKGIEAIIIGTATPEIPNDLLYSGNKVLSFLTKCSVVFIAISLILCIRLIVQLKKGTRFGNKNAKIKALVVPGLTVLVIAILLYFLPIAIYYGFPWRLIKVWGPFSLIPTLLIILLSSVLLSFYWYLKKIYPTQRKYKTKS